MTDSFQEQLRTLNRIGILLTSERDLEKLLGVIVTEARGFTGAEAGSLYIVEDDALHFVVAQNDALPEKGSGFVDLYLPLEKSSIAGYVGLTGETLNLPDVYELPDDVAYEFEKDFDERNDYRTRSMLVLPMQEPDGDTIGVLQLINAKDGGEVVPFDPSYEDLCASLASQAAVAVENAMLTRELKDAYLDTIQRLARAAEFRDDDTGLHIKRMSNYAAAIAETLGWSEERTETLRYAAIMHDVGKIGIPDDILLKPGRLTEEEYEEMKEHAEIGARILADSDVEILRMSETIARTHHERWNGDGYPDGLEGEAIPIEGRITALADVFDALTSRRCYKPAFPLEKALEIIDEERGEHFDPAVVDAFLECLDRILEIRDEYSEEEPAGSPDPASVSSESEGS